MIVRMKQLLILLLLGLWLPLGAQSLQIRDVLKQMPDSVLPYLTVNNRLDMLDFMDSKMVAEVVDALGGKSRMEVLTDSYLRIRTDSSALVEMKLLPSATVGPDSTRQTVCVVHTYGTTAQESQMAFYTAKWKPLTSRLTLDSYAAQLFVRPDTMAVDHFAVLVCYESSLLVSATLSPTANTLTLHAHVPLLEADESKKISSVLCTKVLEWNGKTFK